MQTHFQYRVATGGANDTMAPPIHRWAFAPLPLAVHVSGDGLGMDVVHRRGKAARKQTEDGFYRERVGDGLSVILSRLRRHWRLHPCVAGVFVPFVERSPAGVW